MKPPVIIPCIVCAVLAFALYQRNGSANAEAEQSLKQFESMSNQVAELRTKLALEQGTASQNGSNATYLVTKRTADLLLLSNRVVQTTLLLKAAQAELHEAQIGLQGKAAGIAVLENQQRDLLQQLEAIPTLRRQLAQAKESLAPIATERDSLVAENQRLALESAEAQRQMKDIAFLKLQLDRAEQDMETRFRIAKASQSGGIDSKARLELQPDGTVRAVVAPPDGN